MEYVIFRFYLVFIVLILSSCVTKCTGRDMYYEESFEPETQFDVRRMKANKQENDIMYYDSGLTARHNDIVVFNFGKHALYAESCYASHLTKWTAYTTATVESNGTAYLSVDGSFFLTKLQMNGQPEGTSLAYVYRGTDPAGYVSHKVPKPFTLNIDFLSLLTRFASKAAMKFIPNPFAAIGLSLFIDTFFAKGEKDPWDQVKDRVESKIEEQQVIIISAILDNDLKPIREKVNRIQKSANSSRAKISRKILNNVDSMVGLENKFIFSANGIDNEKLNYALLPLFSQLVNMKLSFYEWCINFAKKLGLDEDDVDDIEIDRNNVIEKAKSHLVNMYIERNDNAYEECSTRDIYNCVMDVRTHVVVNGLDYLYFWLAIKKGKDPSKVVSSGIAYSNYFGRTTINHYRQLYIEFGKPPLTPELKKDKTRAKLTKIVLYLNGDVIVGATEYFDTGKEYSMGKIASTSATIDLNESRIEKMIVGGDKDVSYIIFHLSDGREERYGNNFDRGYSETFELNNHFISSFFVANDAAKNNGKLANIACSFMLNPEVSLHPSRTDDNSEDASSE